MGIEEKFKALKGKSDTLILGIESSCDETAAAVVRGGRTVLSNVILSQIDIHKKFGGVVPEVASRNHTLALPGIVDTALTQAGVKLADVDAVAVTYGAGLIGALLAGVSSAKALAYAAEKPLIKVNHIEAHVAANYLCGDDLQPPFCALVASGGHTLVLDVGGYNKYSLLATTADDAIGEAFDKVARLVGLPYPGGPNVDKAAAAGTANIELYKTPKKVRGDLALSYSGLKTAVVNYVHNKRQKNEQINIPDLCASFTETAVNLLVDTAFAACEKAGRKRLVLAGGVASNSYLRSHIASEAAKRGIEVRLPPPVLCTDNAAMVAARAHFSAFEGENLADLSLNAASNLPFFTAKKPQ